MSSVKVTNLLHGSSASNNIVLASDGTTTVPNLKATTELLVGGVSSTANGGTLQISNGITFPATQSACSNVNTLDDYEEGTWTPAVTGWTSISYITQDGKYTKIGRQVTCWFLIQFSGTSAASNVKVTGLPFSELTISRGGAMTYFNAPLNETTGVLAYLTGTEIYLTNDNDSGTNVSSNGNASGSFLIGFVTYVV